MSQSLLETSPKCSENSPRLLLGGEPPPVFAQWSPSLVPRGWSLHYKAILVQLPFTLEAGAYSVPAEYQSEALPLPSHFFTKPADRLRIKILRPRSSALFWNFLCVPVLSTPPSPHHLMPAVYKLMNSLPATHLKNLILSAQRGQNDIICDAFFERDSDGKEI